MGTPGPLPCTPAGIVELLHAYDVPVEGRHVVIIGRGITIGRPLALLLTLEAPGMQRGGDRRAHRRRRPTSPRSCARRTSSWPRPAGPASSRRTWSSPARPWSSAGTTCEGRKLLPDVDPDVAEVAGWITPRLGGVGPMTRAMLLRNAVRAAEVAAQ